MTDWPQEGGRVHWFGVSKYDVIQLPVGHEAVQMCMSSGTPMIPTGQRNPCVPFLTRVADQNALLNGQYTNDIARPWPGDIIKIDSQDTRVVLLTGTQFTRIPTQIVFRLAWVVDKPAL